MWPYLSALCSLKQLKLAVFWLLLSFTHYISTSYVCLWGAVFDTHTRLKDLEYEEEEEEEEVKPRRKWRVETLPSVQVEIN